MGTPTAEKLKAYYASKQVGSDGAALAQYTADAGGTKTSIVDAALSQSDGYWDDAIGWFDADCVTSALKAVFFHVKSFVTGALTLSRNLPVAPAAGDTYKLVASQGYRCSHEIFGMQAGGALPELKLVAGTNITGLTIKKLSARLGEGTLTIFYDHTAGQVFAKMGSDAYGVGLDTSSNPTGAYLFGADGQAFIKLDIVTASLPGSNQTDTFTLSYPLDTVMPDYEGYETAESAHGKTRYHLEVVKNESGNGDPMVGLTVTPGKPSGAATTIAGGSSLGLTQASFNVTSAAGWPTRGFWVKNKTVNSGAGDCRYINYRSGNTLAAFGVPWATVAFHTGSHELFAGDSVDDAGTGASAIVDQVFVTGGTWGGGDASGTLILKNVVGTFNSSNAISRSGTNCAVSTASSVPGLRGFTAVSWSATDAIELMPDVDIGVGTLSSGHYEQPATQLTAPSGVTFTSDPIELGNAEDTDKFGVWYREWIMAGHQGRAGINDDLTYSWT